MIIHRDKAETVGRTWCKNPSECDWLLRTILRRTPEDVVPKQLFELAIQAAIGSKIIARESLSALRKDVTAGLYGGKHLIKPELAAWIEQILLGHFERKLKHLTKQKEGKKRLKRLAGNIEVPQSAFFEVLSSRRAFSTSSGRRFLDPISEHLPEGFQFQDYPPRHQMTTYQPLSPHVMPPQERSAHLSAIHRLTTTNLSDVTSEDILAAYSNLRSSSTGSQHFSPAELTEIIHSIHKLDRRKGTGRRKADVRLSIVVDDLQRIRQGSRTRGVEPAVLVSGAKYYRLTTSEMVRDAERNLLALFPSPASLVSDSDRRRYQVCINHVLYLCALAKEETRFERWSNRMQEVGMEPDSFAFLARQVLFEKSGRIDELPELLEAALQNVGERDRQIVLVNHVMHVHAVAGRWGVVKSIYSKLRPTNQKPLPAPLDVETNDVPAIPEGLECSRLTYSSLLHTLAHSGHYSAALTIMQHMFDANEPPLVPDYLALFKGFARHGHIPPTFPGPAKRLFPFWETYESSRRNRNRVSLIWSQGALGGPGLESLPTAWTREVLEELFQSFIALSPRYWDLPSLRRAPNARQAWTVLCAFARTTNGDDQVVRAVWEVMDKKFREAQWIGWRSDMRLERLREALESAETRERGRIKDLT